MQRSPMLMDRKDQHSKNGNPTKGNLYIQCNPHQNPNTILHRLFKNNAQLHMEKQQQTQNCHCRGITIPDTQLYFRVSVMKTSSY